MIKNYFKIAWRNLKRSKLYTFINVIGLSMGLACAMLILLYVKDEVSYDRFHKNKDELYRVVYKNINPDGSVEDVGGYSGYLQGPRFKAAIPEIKYAIRYQESYKDMRSEAEIVSQQVYLADSSFFKAFSFPLLRGNPETALQQPNSLVLSEDMALKKFGTVDALGKTISFKEKEKFEPYVVTGVSKNCPENSSIRFDMLMPFVDRENDEANSSNWFNFFLTTFVVLHPGSNQQVVESKMQKFYKENAGSVIQSMKEKYDIKSSTLYSLQPFTDIHLNTDYSSSGMVGSSNPMYSYILSGIALFILLIACINFVNLTVARSVRRSKEIGIRKVMGSNRKQLIFQFLGESFILCSIAFILSLGLVQLVLPIFNKLANKALALSYLFDTKLIAGYFLLYIITGLLAGFYPALVLSGYNPVKTLYNRFQLAGKNYLQKTLVVVQFALASFLIIGTLTIFSQFSFLTNQPLGYEDSNLVVTDVYGISRSEAKLMRDELKRNPAIQEVALKNSGSWSTTAKVNGEQQISFSYETIDETYMPLLKLQVINGRGFSANFPADSTKAVLVNESFAKEAGWKDAIGQEVNFWYEDKKYSVVGVVKDYHFESLNQKIRPQLFTMKPQNGYGRFLVKINNGQASTALAHLEKTYKSLFPIAPYSYQFMDQQNKRRYESEEKWKQILLFSAILTIFISCIGLFGLSVLAAEKRTKEIGVRKVLGASIGSIASSLSRDFIKLVLLALIIAIPVSWIAANKWLANYPYRIQLNWTLFGFSALLVVFIALVTVSYQSIKAAIANPVKSLRSE